MWEVAGADYRGAGGTNAEVVFVVEAIIIEDLRVVAAI